MIRKTLANAKNPDECGIAALINVSPDDPRFLQVLNLATQNLVQTGEMFYGLFQMVRFCVTSGCLVLPRQIAGIESIAVCDQPVTVRNRWYEFLPGVGLRGQSTRHEGPNWDCNACGGEGLIDRGETCCFADIIGTNKKIKVYADVTENSNAKIILLGYNADGQWIRSFVGGEWIDGEKISISTDPVTSTNFFSSLTGAQKPITNGNVRLYEFDADLTTQRAIAIYEPDETNPAYRKMFISSLEGTTCCNCTDDDDEEDRTTQITVMAKLEFVPVRNDTDWLLISNFSALEAEAQSILKRRNNLAEESLTWHAMAIQTLRAELRHYAGRGVVNPMRMQPRSIAGAAVRTLI